MGELRRAVGAFYREHRRSGTYPKEAQGIRDVPRGSEPRSCMGSLLDMHSAVDCIAENLCLVSKCKPTVVWRGFKHSPHRKEMNVLWLSNKIRLVPCTSKESPVVIAVTGIDGPDSMRIAGVHVYVRQPGAAGGFRCPCRRSEVRRRW